MIRCPLKQYPNPHPHNEDRRDQRNKFPHQSEVLDSDLPVLVDFWCKDCGPCKQIEPILEQLAEEMRGIAKITRMDAHENMSVANRYRVRSVPFLVFFKNGEVMDQFVGARITKDELRDRLEALSR